MRKRILSFFFCTMCLLAPAAQSQDRCKHPGVTVKVMTRNMYPGADLGVIAGVDADNLEEVVQTTMESVIRSRIPKRAAQIAAEIAENKPDLVALQEATTWGFKSAHGWTELDQLDSLMDSLRKEGEHYKVAVVQTLTDFRVPDLISYTDHDVILVRASLMLRVVATETHDFDTLLHFPGPDGEIPVLRGWMAAEIIKNECRFKFANTHLEAPLEGIPETQDLQLAQAFQLVNDLSATHQPVILAGDFNSDAEPTQGYPPDETGSYALILQSGYTDAWRDVHANDPVYDYGYTWPLFWEGTGEVANPIERIDLVFLRGLKAVSMSRIGASSTRGLFASDHAGMVAVIQCVNSF
ncbi:MAG TPA: endonuclease/exonuclease/phosphatase family protein [Acidobacteriota bacterium]|nr:endonuclease/exonuclease/phosphatase family protein [Acidobacteriota bacterium]